jgi:ABC-type Zn uptake system ZnuABC Zn-binding protein ZnuA
MSARQLTRRHLLGSSLFILLPFVAPYSTLAQDVTPAAGPVLPTLPDVPVRDGGPLKVVATTPILADLARQIGGARVDATSIIPPNADPHEFEPSPTDVAKLDDADLVIEHGLGLDTWASDFVSSMNIDHAVVATDGIDPMPSESDDGAKGDPHVWFDPMNVKIMAADIAQVLTAIDPEGADAYAARNAAYAAQLDALDQWIATQIATIPPEQRKLVTNHDAFGYYIRRYGLTFVGSVIPSADSGAEPSAQETAELIERIQAEQVPAIFTEASLNPKLEEELAKEAGVEVVPNLYGDNLGKPGSGADTYIGMMVLDTMLIVNALR